MSPSRSWAPSAGSPSGPRGVEFVEAPEARPYGIDASLRDPSGNHLRLTQVMEISAV